MRISSALRFAKRQNSSDFAPDMAVCSLFTSKNVIQMWWSEGRSELSTLNYELRAVTPKLAACPRKADRIKVKLEAVVDHRVVCASCNQEERDCKCDRYCIYCKGQHAIRMCVDGLYYCPDCREACEISVVNSAAN
jgi:hypothetical protein